MRESARRPSARESMRASRAEQMKQMQANNVVSFWSGMIPEDTVLDYAGALFKSIWALELLFAIRRRGPTPWQTADMVRELRGSRVVVAEALNNLVTAGLVIQEDEGGYRYRANSAGVDKLVIELEKLYASKPSVVIRKIVTAQSMKLQILSNAFRIKE